jgi:hypothetical protein
MFRPCWVIFREKTFRRRYTRLHYTLKRECAVDCALRRFSLNYIVPPSVTTTESFLPEDDPAGSKHVGVCYN